MPKDTSPICKVSLKKQSVFEEAKCLSSKKQSVFEEAECL